MAKYVDLQIKPISQWTVAPEAGVIITNPPYGERISADDMDGLYECIGEKLKHVFKGYKAWIIGYKEEYFHKIGLAASSKTPMLNGSLECELREYVILRVIIKTFAKRVENSKTLKRKRIKRRLLVAYPTSNGSRKPAEKGMGGKDGRAREPRNLLEEKYRPKTRRFDKTSPRRKAEDFENPLAMRRNEHALKSIMGKAPSLQAPEGKMMRSRGWKRLIAKIKTKMKNKITV